MTTQKIIEALDRHSTTYIPQPLKEMIAMDIMKEYDKERNTSIGAAMQEERSNPQETEGELDRLKRTLIIFTIIAGVALIAMIILILTTK